MTHLELNIPWLYILLISLLALVGVGTIIYKSIEWFLFLKLLFRGSKPFTEEEREARIEKHFTESDQAVQKIIDDQLNEVWYAFTSTRWLDVKYVQQECIELVKKIARVYHPTAKNPELEVTIFDLLRLNERISREVNALLSPYSTLQKISVSTIFEAKSLVEQTRRVVDQKGVRSGTRIASRIWQAVNFINPKYWINRVLFKGASEVVGRKVLTSIFRIVGYEAKKIYRSSSAVHLHPEDLMNEQIEEKLNIGETEEENQPEIAEEPNEEIVESTISQIIDSEEEPVQEQQVKTGIKQKFFASITQTLNSFIEGSMKLWDKMASREKVLEAYRKQGLKVNDLSDIRNLPIEKINERAESYMRQGELACAAEGAATGAGGFLLLAADAPSLLALQLRVIQQIGYSYGFDVTRPEEKIFAVKLLSEAYMHPAKKERDSLLREMRNAAKLVKGGGPIGLLRQRLFIQGFAKVAEKIGLKMGSRKVAQFVPIIGAVAGGVINKKITSDVARIAQEVYRDRLNQIKTSSPSNP